MQDVGTDLVAPASLDVLAFEACLFRFLLLSLEIEQSGSQDLEGRLTILGLRALVLAGDN